MIKVGLSTSKNNLHKRSKMSRTIAFVTLIVFVITFGVISLYIFKERQLQMDIAENHLRDMTERNAAVVRNVFDGYITTLRALSVYIKDVNDFKSRETLELLRNMAESFDFERLSIDFPDGKSFTTDGIVLKITNEVYLKKISEGCIFITDVTNSLIDGTPRICIQVPLFKNGEVVAALSYSMNTDHISGVLETLLPDEYRYFYLIDEYGRYVSISSKANALFSYDTNFFNALDTIDYSRGFSKELIIEAFTSATSGHTEYSLYGISRYGYYSPVGINNWVMLTVVPKDVVDADTDRFIASSLMLSIEIALILIGFAFILYHDQRRMRSITELDERCFRILSEHTGKVVLEWDYDSKTMYYSNYEKIYGQKPFNLDFNSNNGVVDVGDVHIDDFSVFEKMVKDIIEGHNVEDVQFRLVDSNGGCLYHSVSSVVVFNSKGKPYKSIGFLENIDSRVRKEQQLRKKAEIDQLTGFYNKVASETLISDILASNNNVINALLCIDLDNFKSINDKFGHLQGDDVLKELAGELKKIFRKSDILGRFGGDEFVIFVSDIPNIEFIRTKAEDIVRSLNKTYTGEDISITVSASVGIAISPTNGTTYNELYEKADEASYKVKNSGKNAYRFAV